MYEFKEWEWLYYMDLERCPYALYSTNNPEERERARIWHRHKDAEDSQLAFMRYLDWDRLVTGYN